MPPHGISDQHCMTPDYIVDDILAEASSTPGNRTLTFK